MAESCKITGKASFNSKKDAKDAISRFNRIFDNKLEHSYLCPYCNFWHNTTRKPYKIQKESNGELRIENVLTDDLVRSFIETNVGDSRRRYRSWCNKAIKLGFPRNMGTQLKVICMQKAKDLNIIQ